MSTTSPIIILTPSDTLTSTPTSSGTVDQPPPSNTGRSGNAGLASSAALYLYTFLATLVLLLSVSAAIVIRSFILRRRHRLMVEEAMRNGTWTPHMAGGHGGAGSRPRVDLSKKPVMWETYLGGGAIGASSYYYSSEKTLLGQASHHGAGAGNEWDMIKPVSASYVVENPQGGLRKTGGDVGGAAAGAAGASTGAGAGAGADVPRESILRRAGGYVASAFRTPRPIPPPGAGMGNAAGASGGATGSGEGAGGEVLEKPTTVRVAVLIAMPSPPSLSGKRHVVSPTGSSGSGSTKVGEASSSSMGLGDNHPLSPSLLPAVEDEEKPLPVFEMGVAEVMIVDSDPVEGDGHQEGARGSEDGKIKDGRDSMSVEV